MIMYGLCSTLGLAFDLPNLPVTSVSIEERVCNSVADGTESLLRIRVQEFADNISCKGIIGVDEPQRPFERVVIPSSDLGQIGRFHALTTV